MDAVYLWLLVGVLLFIVAVLVLTSIALLTHARSSPTSKVHQVGWETRRKMRQLHNDYQRNIYRQMRR